MQDAWDFAMTKMPPVPPGNRSRKGAASGPTARSKEKWGKHERYSTAEEGGLASIKQITGNPRDSLGARKNVMVYIG